MNENIKKDIVSFCDNEKVNGMISFCSEGERLEVIEKCLIEIDIINQHNYDSDGLCDCDVVLQLRDDVVVDSNVEIKNNSEFVEDGYMVVGDKR